MQDKIKTALSYFTVIFMIIASIMAVIVCIHDEVNHIEYASAHNCEWNEYDICMLK